MSEVKNKVGAKVVNEDAIIKQISFVGIFGNFVLTAFKLFAGIVGNSGAMVSDAVHSLSDVFATFIAFLGARTSRQEADKEHPYGHERIECIAALALGLILLATGLGIGKVGLENIISGNYANLEIPGIIALVAAVVSIVTKEGMYWYTRHYAKILNSPAFMADAWHHRSDAFSSIGALLGIGGARMGFPILDSVASIVICLFILKVGYDTIKDAIEKMMDTSCGEDYDQKLSEFIKAQDGIEGIDVLHSRMFGSKVYAEVEVRMDGSKSLEEAHALGKKVHDGVEANFPEIKHITIHINPAR